LWAKHPRKKAAKWARDKRPKKTRPSDINRKPRVYVRSLERKDFPPEYTILDDDAVPIEAFVRNKEPFSEYDTDTVMKEIGERMRTPSYQEKLLANDASLADVDIMTDAEAKRFMNKMHARRNMVVSNIAKD